MSILTMSRRGFLKGACVLSAALLLGVRAVNTTYAQVKGMKAYMADRINAVYGAEQGFQKRASQDNVQVQKLYQDWLGKPLSHLSEEHLHTQWIDKSAKLNALKAKGLYPSPRLQEFASQAYAYESE